MQESFSPEQASHAEIWEGTLNAVITAHTAFMDDHSNEEKLSVFQAAFDNALAQAATTDEMGQLIRHVPIDHIHDYHSSSKEKVREKWGQLSNKEISTAKDIVALKHAYDNAPFDEHREIALEKLVEAVTEKDALRIHGDAGAGTSLAIAIEKKFPGIFAGKKGHEESRLNDTDGSYDEKDEVDIMDTIKKAVGIE